MYSWEIDKIIKENNYEATRDLLKIILDVDANPQIDHIIFNPESDIFDIWTNDCYYWHIKFKEEIKEKTR